MSIFQFDYSGVYVGTTAIVMADTRQRAMELLKARFPEDARKIEVGTITELGEPRECILYSDGDY